jgi:gamma-butyrobetaine dioxygenase
MAMGFPDLWLRVNCPCTDCQDPVTGQRLLRLATIPNVPMATVLARTPHEVTVEYAPDGHRSVFSASWLAAHALDGGEPDVRCEDAKVLWRAGTLPELPGADWAAYQADDAVRADCLDATARYGFMLLRGVPAEPGTVLAVAETLGFVRETNYGRLFDVRVAARPANLAFTDKEIGPHTDNPYRDPVPTLALLHCLSNAAPGGDTGLVDGFAAATALRAEDPAAFGVLTQTPWPFRYADDEAELLACRPLIGLTPRGRVREVRFNERSMLPLRLPAAETAAAYAACLAWARLIARPEFRLRLKLAPGDCLVFDNTRVLHARTAFSGAGERHLQGCYADIDGLLSTLAVLRKRM